MFQTNIKHVLTAVAAGLMASAALAVTSGEKPSKTEVELHRHIANTMSQTVRTSERIPWGGRPIIPGIMATAIVPNGRY